MKTVLITGGTGLIGKALTEMLTRRGHKVIILSRSAKPATGNVRYASWDPAQGSIDKTAVAEADAIIHLAGAGVADKRWTKKRKQEISESRVKGGELLVETLRFIPNKVDCVISASAIGWYGPDTRSKKRFLESDPAHTDFLGRTCKLWEDSVRPVTTLNKRLVILRTGIVLSNYGGAFPEFRKSLNAGVAAILGSGRQVISWIHITDLCRMYLEALDYSRLSGVYNAVAPTPVTNKELIIKMARQSGKNFIPVHVPAFILKIMLGEMSIEVLKSTTVDATRIHEAGFSFLYPTIDAALSELAGNK